MGIVIDAKIDGADELSRKLDAMAPKVNRKWTRKALRAGAKPIQAEAIANVPTQLPPYGGQAPDVRLVRKIKVRASKFRKRNEVAVLVRTADRAEFPIPPGAKHYYPAALEYGHDDVAPVPYMRRAFASKSKTAGDIATDILRQGVEAEARTR